MSAQVRERVSRSEVRVTRVRRLPFDLSIGEMIAATLAILLLILVLFYYFSSLKPEQDRLAKLNAELAEQQKSIIANRTPGGPETPVVDSTQNALDSLEAFKSNYLKSFSPGRIALIKEINALAKKNNVSLTSGIDMGSSLGQSQSESETTATGSKSVSKRKKGDDILSAIPSVAFRFAVFGQYANLRTFINEVEHEKQFLVINSINLANQEARTASRRSRGEGTSGIVLTIEMTAYFQPM